MLEQFICVRILNMRDVDVALFQFDFDLTWLGFFLNADNRIYSRFGGRDAKEEDGRVSVAGLKTTMRRVLEAHKTPGDKPAPHKPLLAGDVYPVRNNACIHCHQVNEGTRDRQRTAGTFDPESLHVYPLPENIGLELDRDAGQRIVKVLEKSPAANWLKAGDELRRINGTDIHSQGDVLWALHHAPAKGDLLVQVRRDGENLTAWLTLPLGWRKTDLSWRQSMGQEMKYLK